jgi:hypothetical protein
MNEQIHIRFLVKNRIDNKINERVWGSINKSLHHICIDSDKDVWNAALNLVADAVHGTTQKRLKYE